VNRARQRRRAHAARKVAELRKEAARFVDGNGKHRVAMSRARAAMRRKVK
jgi:hypothetical protein